MPVSGQLWRHIPTSSANSLLPKCKADSLQLFRWSGLRCLPANPCTMNVLSVNSISYHGSSVGKHDDTVDPSRFRCNLQGNKGWQIHSLTFKTKRNNFEVQGMAMSTISQDETRAETGNETLESVSELEDANLRQVVVPGYIDLAAGTQVLQMSGTNLVLPANRPSDSRVKHAEFIKSSADVSQCPQDNRPEFAVVGRSNVGKSSLINMLVNRKDLAQTSKRPGKTQLINHYLINKKWYIVDLPGYGYAKAPTAIRTDWNAFTKTYFLKRKNLVSVMLLIDASIPPQHIDLECAGWLGTNKIPVTILFTKCDKRKKAKVGGKPPAENVKAFEDAITEYYSEPPPWIMTSSVSKMGREPVLMHMSQLRAYWKA